MNKKLHNKLSKIKLYILNLEGLFFSTKNRLFNSEFKCTKDMARCSENRKSPNFRYHYAGKNIPTCCATHLVNILFDTIDILDKHDIQYFMSFGTLLGAVRHKGIIPWDTDVDLIIAKKDQCKVYDTLNKELKNKYLIKVDKSSNIVGGELVRVYYSKMSSLHVDLFPYVENGQNIAFYEEKKFKKEDIFPLGEICFYNKQISTPKNIKQHLSSLYGPDYMTYAYKQWAANNTKFKIRDFSAARIEHE